MEVVGLLDLGQISEKGTENNSIASSFEMETTNIEVMGEPRSGPTQPRALRVTEVAITRPCMVAERRMLSVKLLDSLCGNGRGDDSSNPLLSLFCLLLFLSL